MKEKKYFRNSKEWYLVSTAITAYSKKQKLWVEKYSQVNW